MHRVYEIFEVLPAASPRKVSVISGLEFAKVALLELAKRTNNECFAADAKTRQVVMQMNVSLAKLRDTKRIFQIAYNEELGTRRAEILRSRGYNVISVVGNQAAKVLLSSAQRYDLFMVGHQASEETRREIAEWLKAEYPEVKILALNPPHQQLTSADYNVRQNGPENWLPIVSAVREPRAEQGRHRRLVRRSPVSSATPGPQLQVLCYEHHVEMSLKTIALQGEVRQAETSAYFCPATNCAVHYSPSSGYFVAPGKGDAELKMAPRVRCPHDGQPMYLAEINPLKRAFRRWQCPQCGSSRTNEEGLLNEVADRVRP